MAANMFVFLGLFAFPIGSSATLKCTERRSIELLDCSGLHLASLPRFRQPKIWVKFLDLKRNVIVDLNFSSLAICFPRLEEVDIRENPFGWSSLSSLLPSEFIEVRSDCEPRLTALPPTTTTSLLYAKTATTDVSFFSQHRTNFTTHHVENAEGCVLLISLLSSFCVLSFVLLFAFWIIWKRRVYHRTDTEQIAMVNMRRFSSSSSLSSDSDCIVYRRERVRFRILE